VPIAPDPSLIHGETQEKLSLRCGRAEHGACPPYRRQWRGVALADSNLSGRGDPALF